MRFNFLIFIVISSLFFGCGNQNKAKETDNVLSGNILTDEAKLDMLKTEASRLRGGGSIKNVELNGGKATIIYVSNYKEYKEINPQSSLTEVELNGYWETEDSIQKALNDGSVRIMRKLDFISEVNIILPFNENIYEISVNRLELERFVGKDFKTIEENWDTLFSNPYVYDKNGRQVFFEKFGAKK
ncbi:MAG: hypothetical protein KF870_13250 [Leadbetterella sp.]|nr:hypothetical protein [Leadbetterella sp.]